MITVIPYEELEALPTLAVGQAANLKIDTGTMRVWVSRCGIADGETQPVQIERLVGDHWQDVDVGKARTRITLDGDYTGKAVEVWTRLISER